MAQFDFEKLKKVYGDFENPMVVIKVEGTSLGEAKQPMAVTDLDVDLTSGFEASMATFRVFAGYDQVSGKFTIDKIKKMLFLGSAISIAVGYGINYREVFRGFIAKVHFIVPRDTTNEIPSIEVTAMDPKAAMMSNRHSMKLKAAYWSDAVQEVLDKNPFLSTADFDDQTKKFVDTVVKNTPDKPEGSSEGGGAAPGGAGGGAVPGGAGGEGEKASDKRMEMVEESDYEFVVKAAKKYNFRFFASAGSLYFVDQPGPDAETLVDLYPSSDIRALDVGYDMTGLVKKVEVRTLDSDQGNFVKDQKKTNVKISLGNKAKSMVDQQTLVYLDPTAENKEEAGYRAQYLLDQTSYRLGSLELEMAGLPELMPGGIVELKEFGTPVDNKFYLTRVRHIYDWKGYRTEIEGKADRISS